MAQHNLMSGQLLDAKGESQVSLEVSSLRALQRFNVTINEDGTFYRGVYVTQSLCQEAGFCLPGMVCGILEKRLKQVGQSDQRVQLRMSRPERLVCWLIRAVARTTITA